MHSRHRHPLPRLYFHFCKARRRESVLILTFSIQKRERERECLCVPREAGSRIILICLSFYFSLSLLIALPLSLPLFMLIWYLAERSLVIGCSSHISFNRRLEGTNQRLRFNPSLWLWSTTSASAASNHNQIRAGGECASLKTSPKLKQYLLLQNTSILQNMDELLHSPHIFDWPE